VIVPQSAFVVIFEEKKQTLMIRVLRMQLSQEKFIQQGKLVLGLTEYCEKIISDANIFLLYK